MKMELEERKFMSHVATYLVRNRDKMDEK